MSRKLKYILPVILYCVVIYFLSGLTGDSTPKIPISDKIIHVVVYSGLGFLVARSLTVLKPQNLGRANFVLLSTIFCALYGVSDEVHQLFVDGRYSEFEDVVADAIGGALGSTAFIIIRESVGQGYLKWASRIL